MAITAQVEAFFAELCKQKTEDDRGCGVFRVGERCFSL